MELKSQLTPFSLLAMLIGASAFERVPTGYSKKENPSPVSSDFNCSYGNSVDALPIYAGIKDLYRTDGEICHAPGNEENSGCAMMTCINSSSIWLCNDNSGYLSTLCKYVADNAVELLIQCETAQSTVRGQIFSADKTWNVIIDEGSC